MNQAKDQEDPGIIITTAKSCGVALHGIQSIQLAQYHAHLQVETTKRWRTFQLFSWIKLRDRSRMRVGDVVYTAVM